MAVPNVDFSSPYYPYRKVIEGNEMRGAELIPYKIMMYLLDMPDSAGYTPVDDNERPRVRLIKLLTFDGPNPLAQPLPSPQEKLSILFNGDEPDINTDEQQTKHPYGYRLFTQRNIAQSGIKAKTILKIYPGRVLDPTDSKSVIGFQAEIWTNPNFSSTKTTSRDRLWDIECELRDSLNGVDIQGVGCIKFCRQDGSFNGSENLFGDNGEIGRIVYFSTNWLGGGAKTITTYNI